MLGLVAICGEQHVVTCSCVVVLKCAYILSLHGPVQPLQLYDNHGKSVPESCIHGVTCWVSRMLPRQSHHQTRRFQFQSQCRSHIRVQAVRLCQCWVGWVDVTGVGLQSSCI